MGNNQRKTGAILSYIILAINSVVGILYTPIMLRFMGHSEYGLYSLVASIIAYLTMFDLGLGNAVVRYIAKYRAVDDKKSESKLSGMFLVIYTIIGGIVLLIGIIFSLNIESIFSKSLTTAELEKAKILFLILSFNLAVSFPLGIFSSIMTAYERFVFPKIITIIRTVLMPFVMIPLLYAGYKSIAMVIVISILNIVGLLINAGYCFNMLKIKLTFGKFDYAILKDIAPYSFYIFLNIVVDKLYTSTNQFILGIVSGTVAVAVYAIAMQLYNYYVMLSTSINSVFLPRLTEIAANSQNPSKEFSDIFVRIGRIQFIILSFALSGFILFGQTFLALWAGEGYDSAYYICLILMIPAIIPLSQNIGIVILQAKNRHKFRSVVYIVIAIINVLISIPLGKLYEGIGVAIGTSLATFVGQICTMNWYYFKRMNINIPEYWKQIAKITFYVLVTLIFGILLNFIIEIKGWISFTANIMIYSTIFSIFMWKFAINHYEHSLLISIFKRIITRTRRL